MPQALVCLLPKSVDCIVESDGECYLQCFVPHTDKRAPLLGLDQIWHNHSTVYAVDSFTIKNS